MRWAQAGSRWGPGTPCWTTTLEQDLISVGGGSLISLLGTWTAHGIDGMLRAAWENGTVLADLSAGSLCWFDHAITAFHGESRRVQGLGFLPHSNAVHDDTPERRQTFLEAIADGMPPGYGTGDGAALHFRRYRSRPRGHVAAPARAHHVAPDGADVIESELATHFLGAPVAVEPARAA